MTDANISQLGSINHEMENIGKCLQVCISIPTSHGWRQFEKNTTAPDERIILLRKLYSEGIKTSVAIRPMLPTVGNDELCEIVERTRACCYGYITGPLYLGDRLKASKVWRRVSVPVTGRRGVNWMAGGKHFDYVSGVENSLKIKSLVELSGLRLFEDNVELVRHLEELSMSRRFSPDFVEAKPLLVDSLL